ncbi:hypothetical protein FOPG_17729 [Fusarium oxysporum f. sp. conglutinans race 2 54008]|uniref:F-box domain-containing protein n=2 Tax=Fusarium oxysporum f. sp. conglutinans TaxID=100902 RepID=F9FKG6_FUSOF|nr:hypothetical protein FOXB_06895 [Fusarium oxysporum f. sp. conglutinans Fo5176]EXL66078.1 hypothetical protein FOPG_17729 [Fusarium oxysporum f. sp. conglutinans race 2 54008]KAG7004062.1 hypothetical protein FocnCong_v001100 [Fusarium oxysporum f. sp. conglutinans]KAI8395894.1 hypothetical protein FOFC_21424 [Fusarium oxysporum]
MATLQSLPEHAIQFIAEYFSTADFFAFRQTCRDMNAKTFSTFGHTFFRTRYVMLERGSLDTLIRISEDPFLGSEVCTLGICTKRLLDSDEPFNAKPPFWSTPIEDSGSDDSDFWHGRGTEPRFDDSNDGDIFDSSYADIRCQYFEDQEDYVSDHDVDALTRAMSRLHNCKTLVLTDVEASWEAQQLAWEAGWLARGPACDRHDHQPFLKRVLNVMLTAAKASGLPVEEFGIYLGYPDEHNRTYPMSFHLLDSPPKCMIKSGLEGGLASVTTLRLLTCPPGEVAMGEVDWVPNFRRFLGFFPKLSHFSLAFEDEFDDHTAFPGLSSALSIVQLQRLELAHLEVTEGELAELFLHHRSTLHDVTLRGVNLYGSRRWIRLLGKVRQIPELRSMHLKGCLLSVVYFSGEVDSHEIDEVCLRSQQDYEGLIAKMEELIATVVLDEEMELGY